MTSPESDKSEMSPPKFAGASFVVQNGVSTSSSDATAAVWPLDQVTLVGVGLLGGSLGMALKKRGLARRVVGLGRKPLLLEEAVKSGCIDVCETDPARALPGANLVVLCQPVTVIVDFLPICFEHISPGTVVTDVGSTKATIMAAGEAAAAKRGDSTAFVGSHPMAGSERSGARWANADLFFGATCHVTVTPQTPSWAAARIVELWRRIGSRIILGHPERHDLLVAAISHAPHLVSIALMESLDPLNTHPQLRRMLAGPGFRDMTRIAMGSTEMWLEIYRENRQAIVARMDELIRLLVQWRDRVDREEQDVMRTHFDAARAHRSELSPPTLPENRPHGNEQ